MRKRLWTNFEDKNLLRDSMKKSNLLRIMDELTARLFGVGLIVIFVSCSGCDYPKDRSDFPTATPMVRILAQPEQYDGKRVSTVGVLRVIKEIVGDRKMARLYLEEGHARNETYYDWIALGSPLVIENELYRIVAVPDEEEMLSLDMEYVRVEGAFELYSDDEPIMWGHFNSVGMIDRLAKLEPMDSPPDVSEVKRFSEEGKRLKQGDSDKGGEGVSSSP